MKNRERKRPGRNEDDAALQNAAVKRKRTQEAHKRAEEKASEEAQASEEAKAQKAKRDKKAKKARKARKAEAEAAAAQEEQNTQSLGQEDGEDRDEVEEVDEVDEDEDAAVVEEKTLMTINSTYDPVLMSRHLRYDGSWEDEPRCWFTAATPSSLLTIVGPPLGTNDCQTTVERTINLLIDQLSKFSSTFEAKSPSSQLITVVTENSQNVVDATLQLAATLIPKSSLGSYTWTDVDNGLVARHLRVVIVPGRISIYLKDDITGKTGKKGKHRTKGLLLLTEVVTWENAVRGTSGVTYIQHGVGQIDRKCLAVGVTSKTTYNTGTEADSRDEDYESGDVSQVPPRGGGHGLGLDHVFTIAAAIGAEIMIAGSLHPTKLQREELCETPDLSDESKAYIKSVCGSSTRSFAKPTGEVFVRGKYHTKRRQMVPTAAIEAMSEDAKRLVYNRMSTPMLATTITFRLDTTSKWSHRFHRDKTPSREALMRCVQLSHLLFRQMDLTKAFVLTPGVPRPLAFEAHDHPAMENHVVPGGKHSSQNVSLLSLDPLMADTAFDVRASPDDGTSLPAAAAAEAEAAAAANSPPHMGQSTKHMQCGFELDTAFRVHASPVDDDGTSPRAAAAARSPPYMGQSTVHMQCGVGEMSQHDQWRQRQQDCLPGEYASFWKKRSTPDMHAQWDRMKARDVYNERDCVWDVEADDRTRSQANAGLGPGACYVNGIFVELTNRPAYSPLDILVSTLKIRNFTHMDRTVTLGQSGVQGFAGGGTTIMLQPSNPFDTAVDDMLTTLARSSYQILDRFEENNDPPRPEDAFSMRGAGWQGSWIQQLVQHTATPQELRYLLLAMMFTNRNQSEVIHEFKKAFCYHPLVDVHVRRHLDIAAIGELWMLPKFSHVPCPSDAGTIHWEPLGPVLQWACSDTLVQQIDFSGSHEEHMFVELQLQTFDNYVAHFHVEEVALHPVKVERNRARVLSIYEQGQQQQQHPQMDDGGDNHMLDEGTAGSVRLQALLMRSLACLDALASNLRSLMDEDEKGVLSCIDGLQFSTIHIGKHESTKIGDRLLLQCTADNWLAPFFDNGNGPQLILNLGWVGANVPAEQMLDELQDILSHRVERALGMQERMTAGDDPPVLRSESKVYGYLIMHMAVIPQLSGDHLTTSVARAIYNALIRTPAYVYGIV
jgi:hypothetical protein